MLCCKIVGSDRRTFLYIYIYTCYILSNLSLRFILKDHVLIWLIITYMWDWSGWSLEQTSPLNSKAHAAFSVLFHFSFSHCSLQTPSWKEQRPKIVLNNNRNSKKKERKRNLWTTFIFFSSFFPIHLNIWTVRRTW